MKRMDRISVDRCERITDQWRGRLSIDIELQGADVVNEKLCRNRRCKKETRRNLYDG